MRIYLACNLGCCEATSAKSFQLFQPSPILTTADIETGMETALQGSRSGCCVVSSIATRPRTSICQTPADPNNSTRCKCWGRQAEGKQLRMARLLSLARGSDTGLPVGAKFALFHSCKRRRVLVTQCCARVCPRNAWGPCREELFIHAGCARRRQQLSKPGDDKLGVSQVPCPVAKSEAFLHHG